MREITITIIFSLIALISVAQTEKPQISIYPNPFADSVTYKVTANYGDSLELKIYDLQGRLKLNLEKQPIYKTQTVLLTAESLNNGTYIISTLVDSTTFNNKIIKNGGASNIQFELEIAVKPLLLDELIIYPNPTSSELNVIVKSTAKNVKISLYDLEGKMLIEEEVENENGIIKWNTNLTGMTNGIYIIHSKSKSGEFSRRIVKSD